MLFPGDRASGVLCKDVRACNHGISALSPTFLSRIFFHFKKRGGSPTVRSFIDARDSVENAQRGRSSAEIGKDRPRAAACYDQNRRAAPRNQFGTPGFFQSPRPEEIGEDRPKVRDDPLVLQFEILFWCSRTSSNKKFRAVHWGLQSEI